MKEVKVINILQWRIIHHYKYTKDILFTTDAAV
jgi:hypothetical protein